MIPKHHNMISRRSLRDCLCVAGLDEGIGNVTATLKKKGMWENTIMFFSSDNVRLPAAISH